MLTRYTKMTENERFYKALNRGTVENVKSMLDDGFEAKVFTYNGQSALHCAICPRIGIRALEIVKLLVTSGVSVNCRSENGRTALHVAVRLSKYPIVDFLIECMADVNAQDERGESPLHEAVRFGDTHMVLQLVRAGASLGVKSKDGLSPIWLLITDEDGDCCPYLLEYLALHGSSLAIPDSRVVDLDCILDNVITVFLYACQTFGSEEWTLPLLHQEPLPDFEETDPAQVCLRTRTVDYIKDLGFVFKTLNDWDKRTPELKENYKACCDIANQSVLSLSSICCCYIRLRIHRCNEGKSVVPLVQKLPLPTTLQEFLTFKDRLDIVEMAMQQSGKNF